MGNMYENQKRTIFTDCEELSDKTYKQFVEISSLSNKLLPRSGYNKALEMILKELLDEHLSSTSTDLLSILDILYQVDECNHDFDELAYVLEKIYESKGLKS